MLTKEQRIHGWILMGILIAILGATVSGLLWVVLALSGDVVGAAAARIAAISSSALLAILVVGQAVWNSYSRLRAP